HGGAPAAVFEIAGGESVSNGAIGGGERPVGGVAHQRVAEAVLDLAREATLRAALEELALLEHFEPAIALAAVGAEQRRHAAVPAGLAEDAGRAQGPPRSRLEPADARLQHGQHRLWHLGALALGS